MMKSSILRNKIVLVITSVFIFLLSVILPVCVYSEDVRDSDFGYSLDIPEGYQVAEYTPDGMSYRFVHDRMPVNLLLKLYSKGEYDNSKNALDGTLKKLSAVYDIDTFTWRNEPCAIASMEMTLPMNETKYSGWSISVVLPENNAILVLVCYADFEIANDCQQFIISTLNSLCIDRGSYYAPGIFTTYAFPSQGTKKITLKINGKEIQTEIDKDDEAASKFVIDCEYAVLSLYANNDKWQDAWVRYYKCIFRDSYSRLRKVSFDINSALIPLAQKENKDNPNYAMNEMLLDWVQNFSYERQNQDSKKSDFENLPAILCGAGSDCDSRSTLLCVILGNMGIKTSLFISREYSHAIYGVTFDIPGAKINVSGTDYLLCETTAKGVKPGLIASDMNDTEKWIPVELF